MSCTRLTTKIANFFLGRENSLLYKEKGILLMYITVCGCKTFGLGSCCSTLTHHCHHNVVPCQPRTGMDMTYNALILTCILSTVLLLEDFCLIINSDFFHIKARFSICIVAAF